MIVSRSDVIKGSREDLLEKMYVRLEAEYEFEGKSEQLNCLQEMMVMFSTLSNKNAIMIFKQDDTFDFKTWYEKNE